VTKPIRSKKAIVEPQAAAQAEPRSSARPQAAAQTEPHSDAEFRNEPEAGSDAEPHLNEHAELGSEVISSTLAGAAGAAGSAIVNVANSAGGQMMGVVHGAGELAQQARQAIGERAEHIAAALAERPGARVRRVRRMAKDPLPVLWDVHPDARHAPMREVGVLEVPVEKIRGTAQEVGDRGGDFLPLKPFRGDNWRARWQRILSAVDNLKQLPPVDLLRTGDEYWVVDGHNRVAAALYNGQLSLDANVMDLRLPGSPRPPGPSGPIAPYLAEQMFELRAAGVGRPLRSGETAGASVPVADDHRRPPDEPEDEGH
jgi:hypothetical protein